VRKGHPAHAQEVALTPVGGRGGGKETSSKFTGLRTLGPGVYQFSWIEGRPRRGLLKTRTRRSNKDCLDSYRFGVLLKSGGSEETDQGIRRKCTAENSAASASTRTFRFWENKK